MCVQCAHKVNIRVCYAQTVDLDNPWIACSICRSHKTKGIEHGFGQSSDTDVHHTEGCLSKLEFSAGMKPSDCLSLQSQTALIS